MPHEPAPPRPCARQLAFVFNEFPFVLERCGSRQQPQQHVARRSRAFGNGVYNLHGGNGLCDQHGTASCRRTGNGRRRYRRS